MILHNFNHDCESHSYCNNESNNGDSNHDDNDSNKDDSDIDADSNHDYKYNYIAVTLTMAVLFYKNYKNKIIIKNCKKIYNGNDE